MSVTLDFGEIEAAKARDFMKPGQYELKVEKVELGDNKSGTKHMAVVFVRKSDEEQKFTEKFHLEGKNAKSTSKLLGRLQYLHEAWTGKSLNKAFTSLEEMADYFNKCLTHGNVSKPMVVGGTISNDAIYCNLPWSGFVVDPENFEERVYDPESPEFKKVVRTQKTDGAVANNDSPVINAGSTDEKLPWE